MNHTNFMAASCVQLAGGPKDTSARVARAIWSALRELDGSLPGDLPVGLGQCEADRLNVKWASSVEEPDGACLALDVLDKEQLAAWEMGVVPLPGASMLGYRIHRWHASVSTPGGLPGSSLDAVWDQSVKSLATAAAPTMRHQPCFMAIAAAVAAQGDVSVIRDQTATVQSLQSDLEYWRGLARDQRKLREVAGQGRYAARRSVPRAQEDSAPEPQAPVAQRALRELGEWAAENSERIVILPRAIAEAKRSVYEDAAGVYAALELLASEYTALRRAEITHDAFKARALALGLENRGSVDPSVAGEQGEKYYVRWNGRRRFLDQHLAKGTARDPRFTMRIYYTWDADQEKVVVGWLPTHLSNSKT